MRSNAIAAIVCRYTGRDRVTEISPVAKKIAEAIAEEITRDPERAWRGASIPAEITIDAMHLTTLVGILENDLSEGPTASTREELARLYTERGHHQEAAQQRRMARRASDGLRQPPRPPRAVKVDDPR